MFTSANDFNLTTLFIHKALLSRSLLVVEDVVCEAACLLNLYVSSHSSWNFFMNGVILLNEIESRET
jgi:hypothetical protein